MELDALARSPSPESWRLLCEQLERMAEPAALAAIAALEPILDTWPDELRATMCGMTWDDQFFDGAPNPRSTIVRYLRFDRYFTGRYDSSLRTRSRALGAPTIRRMCSSAGVRFLKRINLSYQLDASAVRELAACTHFGALEQLEIDGCALDGATIGALAAAPLYGRLARLDVTKCEIDADTVALLFRDRCPRELDLGSNPIGPAGATAIAEQLGASPRRLGLASCELGDDGAAALARCTAALERLVLDDNAIGDRGVAALVAGALTVQKLSIRAGRITHAGVRVLVEARWPLVELDLADNALDDAAAYAIALAGPETLATLAVSDNDLTGDGLVAILGAARLAGLRELDAGTNRIGVFPRALASAMNRLEVLSLAHNRLGDGIRSLAAIESESLVELDLTDNVIGVRELEELTGASWFSRLKTLKLRSNPLGVGAGVVFGAWTALDELDLSRTRLGDDGACTLFDAGVRPKELSLDGCGLTDAALEHLVASPAMARLEVLRLRDNALTTRGVKALLAAAPPALKQIFVGANRIDDEGVVALAGWQQLLHVGAGSNPCGKAGEAALAARPVRCCP